MKSQSSWYLFPVRLCKDDNQIMNPFDATQPIFIHVRIPRVPNYFDVSKQTQEKYDNPINLKIELMVEAAPIHQALS